MWPGQGGVGPWVLAWQRPAARAAVLLCARMFACNQLTSCLSLLPPSPPLLCLNNHYLFKRSMRAGSGLRPAGQEQVPFC